MFDWLSELWDAINYNLIAPINELVLLRSRINEVSFEDNEIIIRFLGNLRYIVGDIIYIMIIAIFQFAGALALFKLIRALVNMIVTFIPSLKSIKLF